MLQDNKYNYFAFAKNINNTQKLLLIDASIDYKTYKIRTLNYYSDLLGIEKKMIYIYLKDLVEKNFICSLNLKDEIKFKMADKESILLSSIKEQANFNFDDFLDYIENKKEIYSKKGKRVNIGEKQLLKTAKFLNDLKDYDLATTTLELSIANKWIGLFPEQAKKQLKQKISKSLEQQNISVAELIKAPNNTIVKNGIKYTAIFKGNAWEIDKCLMS